MEDGLLSKKQIQEIVGFPIEAIVIQSFDKEFQPQNCSVNLNFKKGEMGLIIEYEEYNLLVKSLLFYGCKKILL